MPAPYSSPKILLPRAGQHHPAHPTVPHIMENTDPDKDGALCAPLPGQRWVCGEQHRAQRGAQRGVQRRAHSFPAAAVLRQRASLSASSLLRVKRRLTP